jgi:DNA-binding transcriptional ArsR family regulator
VDVLVIVRKLACVSALDVNTRKKKMTKKLTPSEKYRQLKKHTEDAGMKVTEKDGKIIVTRKKKK